MATLQISREDAHKKIEERINKGNQLLEVAVTDSTRLHSARADRRRWHDFNKELLAQLFSDDRLSKEYERGSHLAVVSMGYSSLSEQIQDYRESIQRRLNALTSILERLELFPESTTLVDSTCRALVPEHFSNLHRAIRRGCTPLYEGGHFGEAVEKGFKIVRDRLRTITGYETGSEAFGKGGLYINGSIAPHVDYDFQNAVKFLTMAIDNFRNEKAHSSDGGVASPERAYEYLALSSLAMHHLDKAEVRPH